MRKVAVLKGDGVGPSVMNEALRVLDALKLNEPISLSCVDFGGAALDKYGVPLRTQDLEEIKSCNAVLLGAIGGPNWDHVDKELRPEKALLKLRKELDLYANIRPIKPYPSLPSKFFKQEHLNGIDLVIVRELLGGLYFGEPRFKKDDEALNSMRYTRRDIERISKMAFNLATKRRNKVTLVDKANVLEVSVLWREVVSNIAKEYANVKLEFMLVDNASMQLIINPASFDVVLCENLFGDILSDEASVLTGSIGLLGSQSIGSAIPKQHIGREEESAAKRKPIALFEPIHGSAPDIAGLNIANPIGMIQSLSMLLNYLDENEAQESIDKAILNALNNGARTKDLGGTSTTEQLGDEIIRNIKKQS